MQKFKSQRRRGADAVISDGQIKLVTHPELVRDEIKHAYDINGGYVLPPAGR